MLIDRVDTQRNLHGLVAAELGNRIVNGSFKPDEVLPDEATLCARFGVSRTVIREAIKVLSAKGLVETRPKRGTAVRPVRFWSRLDPDILIWQDNAAPSEDFLQKLTEVRRIVEPPAAELAALRATSKEIDRIAKAYQRMCDGFQDVDTFIASDIQFHASIIEASHNELLQPINNVIRAAMLVSLRVTNLQADKNRQSLPFHLAILEAVQNRDSAEAGAAMRRHLDDTWQRIETKLAQKDRSP